MTLTKIEEFDILSLKGKQMEYPKIETLYERNPETFKLKSELIFRNPVYDLIKTWQWTEKIDGTNIRCEWRGNHLNFFGRTNKAEIHPDLLKYLQKNICPEMFQKVFPEEENVIIYGEGYGAGIQKGGGLYSPTKKFIIFDVFIIDPANTKLGGWWLNDENMRDVATKFGLDAVPFVGDMTIAEATAMVHAGFPSALSEGKARAEGLVGRTVEPLFDKKGHRLIVKLKTKDFSK